jgi:hypothetical protein
VKSPESVSVYMPVKHRAFYSGCTPPACSLYHTYLLKTVIAFSGKKICQWVIIIFFFTVYSAMVLLFVVYIYTIYIIL